MILLTLPIATRERVLIRTLEAQAMHGGALPRRIDLSAHDHMRLKLDMRRYGFHGKPLDVLNVPIRPGAVRDGLISFNWDEGDGED